ncbi:MAG: hypothetical protein KBS91_02040 [Firmicutes bacterium]|nr:hypothetical protein [Candidatus Caballimonas caccae]
MIKVEQLAKKLNDELNTLMLQFGNDKLQFRIITDTANYKRPSRLANTVTTYIQGVLSQINSSIENTSNNQVYAVLNLRLALIIPVIEDNEKDSLQLLPLLRGVLDKWATANEQGIMTDNEDYQFTYSIDPFTFTTGERQLNALFGDCIVLNGLLNCYFVQQGLNTKAITFTLDGHDIPFQAYSISRSSILESNTKINSDNSISKNTPLYSQIKWQFTLPAQINALDSVISGYIDDGDLSTHTLVKKIKKGNTTTQKTYSVVFSESGETGENIKNIGRTIVLAEVLPFAD